MNPTHASTQTRIKVGMFTLMGLALCGALTVYVNDKPFWWRACDLVHINVDDATGLKTKSGIRSLGLEIGYLKNVELSETHVKLGICITAPVEVLPSTRAYIRGEGFLGDKFVELKPVRYTGGRHEKTAPAAPVVAPTETAPTDTDDTNKKSEKSESLYNWFIPNVEAAEPVRDPKEIPVGQKSQDMEKLVNQVDNLVVEMTHLTTNLKDSIDPKELRSTMQSLNKAISNASKTLSPEGSLNTTAQRALAKLEDAIEQLRDMMTRVNQGQGSIGMILNDPTYADEIKEALKSLNKILGHASTIRFVINVGAEQIPTYTGGRGFFELGIWPEKDRYYLIGVAIDPRGKLTNTSTTTTSGGVTTVVSTSETVQGSLLITAMLGKVYYKRLDLSVGAIYGDGAVSVAIDFGPHDREGMFVFRNDIYSRGQGIALNDRLKVQARPFDYNKSFQSLYVEGGVESFRQVDNKVVYFYGAGISFDDDDIKLLFAFK